MEYRNSRGHQQYVAVIHRFGCCQAAAPTCTPTPDGCARNGM